MTVTTVAPARVVFSAEDRRAILAMIDESLQSGSLTLGPTTRAFEQDFAVAHEAPYAIAVSSGTSALEIIFRSVGLAGREVVVPTNTFFATAAAVVHSGAVPRFADVSADTLALSVASVNAAITPATAAVVLVHIGGLITPEADAIRALCERRGLVLIEDAAHAHGSTLHGRRAGSWGRAAAFSFYPTKVITSGEGGMVLTADVRLRDEALIYRDQGKAGFLGGDHVRMGSAWRMSEVAAAIGLVHLRRLDEFVHHRRRIAALYDRFLTDIDGVDPIATPPGCSSNYYKYVALLAPGIDRVAVKRRLGEDHGIGLSGEVYGLPLHRQPVFVDLAAGSFPVADDVCARHICLPLHSDMSQDEAAYVIEGIRSAISEASI